MASDSDDPGSKIPKALGGIGSAAIKAALAGAGSAATGAAAAGGAVAGVAAAAGGAAAGGAAAAGAASSLSEFVANAGTAKKAVDIIGDVIDKVTDFFDGESAGVRYRFTCQGVETSEWQVRTVEFTEGVSILYHLALELITDDVTAEPTELFGRACTLELERGTLRFRRVHGIVAGVTHGGTAQERQVANLSIAPALHALELRSDTRVFQDRSVPEILEEVLAAGLKPHARKLRCELQRKEYPKREYTVQYRESDFAFAQRLMADEGIFFYFDHEGDEAEELVLVDANKTCAMCEPDEFEIRLGQGGLGEVERVSEFFMKTKLVSTSHWLAGYDWTLPATAVKNVLPGEGDELGDRPEYDPGGVTSFEYSASSRAYQKRDEVDRARLGHERQLAKEHVASGKSNVTVLETGRRVSLVGHPNAALDNEYLVTGVRHRGAGVRDGGGGAGQQDYENDFDCIPAARPFRSAVLAAPRIHGVQTATVVGPSGEEIHTDEHGRIQVRFHWARKADGSAENDDSRAVVDVRSTCFVRVAQAWAGQAWGFVFLPRIGMEVVVTFVDGDPDRPLVTGCVYNGLHATPYLLPDDKTKSTIKTQSSPGGDGYNELRFEDAAGKEEIFVHAQKDMNEVVEHNHATTVHANQTNSVDVNRSVTVGGDQAIHVKGNQTVTIDGGGKSAVHSTVTVTGKHQLDATDTIEVQAPTHIKLTCGGSTLLMEPRRITLTAGDGSTLVLDINALLKSKEASEVLLSKSAIVLSPDGGNILLNADALMASKAGSKAFLDANAQFLSSGAAELLLDANATMKSSQGSSVTLDASATMSGTATATVSAPTASLEGAAKASLVGGAGSVGADPSGVTVSGPIVKLN